MFWRENKIRKEKKMEERKEARRKIFGKIDNMNRMRGIN